MPDNVAPEDMAASLATYDAGLLNDWGGGNVEWWQDYIRAELARADEFYREQVAAWNARAAIAAMPERGWQPIETAPRDGTQVLITGGTVYFDAETFPEDRPFGGVQIAAWHESSQSWIGPYGSEYDAQYWHSPSHWQPLPTPPERRHERGC